MDEILLYLSLKYFGEWMAIYDSLQKKEELKVYDIKKAVNEVDADWITLISSDYPKNLKAIYKPPFGVFNYGKSKLLHQNIVTVFGKIDEDNVQYLDCLRSDGFNLLWVKKSNKEMLDILATFPTNNIFYMEEMKNAGNKTFQNILSNENIIMENAFCSEIWERKSQIDYSNQWQERLYLGLSLQVLIVSELKAKELLALSQYCDKENIKVGILKKVYSSKEAKAFKNNKVFIIDELDQLSRVFLGQN
ncbi:MAG: hypothetical protein KBS35_02790 [Mycoplasma sp.]|nr:hypothetical protein [Candidatus Hennigella equi]